MIEGKKILLTGGRAPACLELARYLAKNNQVHVADSLSMSICRFSNQIKQFHKIRSPQNREHFYQDLSVIIKRHDIDLIIPTCEEAFYLSMIKDRLSDLCDVFCDDITLMRQLHSKIDVMGLAKYCDIHTPRTERITEDSIDSVRSNFKEYVAKLEYSRFSSGVHLNSPKKLDFNIDIHNSWVLQEKVYGEEFCTYAVAKKGKVLHYSIYQPKYRLKDSASVYFEKTNHFLISTFIHKFIERNNYTGQIGFDIIENDKGIHLIEANPRATSGIHLVLSSTPKFLMLPFLLVGFKATTLSKVWQIFHQARDVVFCKNDVKPFTCQTLAIIEYGLIMIKHKCSLVRATTRDIEWNGKLPIN